MKKARPVFNTIDDAVVRLKGFGTKGENGKIFYLEKPVGLKFLGAVDYLIKSKVTVIFDKKPKETKHGVR